MKKVTEEMKEAGNKIASELMDASISKSVGGLGGSRTWEDYKNANKEIENFDLISAYINKEIDSVTAIYLAMDRCDA